MTAFIGACCIIGDVGPSAEKTAFKAFVCVMNKKYRSYIKNKITTQFCTAHPQKLKHEQECHCENDRLQHFHQKRHKGRFMRFPDIFHNTVVNPPK